MADLWGVALGGVIGFVSALGAKQWEEYRLRRALRAASGAEINGILEIAEARGHVRNAEEWLERWRHGEDHAPQMFGPDDRKMPEDQVYNRNADKIGMLGADAADVAVLHEARCGSRQPSCVRDGTDQGLSD
jgi:hypothetical protein